MRGKIKHTKRAQQINDFSGLNMGYNITPTDIDGLIEYRNQKYVFFEVKYQQAELPYGQRLALERLVVDTAKSGKKSIAIVCEHDVKYTDEDVDVAIAKVREVYSYRTRKWTMPAKYTTVKQLIQMFIEMV